MIDRAQSEALGFVIVFALILATVSFITVAGLGELKDVRDAKRVDNVHEPMQVLPDNVDELVVGSAPIRQTELGLGSGDLAFGDPVPITVSGHATGDPDQSFSSRCPHGRSSTPPGVTSTSSTAPVASSGRAGTVRP